MSEPNESDGPLTSEEWVARAVAAAPPLTEETMKKIAVLLSQPSYRPPLPPRLRVSRWITHTATGAQPRWEIKPDGHRHGMGSCGRTGHFSATTPVKHRDRLPWYLDCPCDAPCPKCKAAVGFGCETPTGYPAKWHAVRIPVSPRCAALLDGTVTLCEVDRHDWVFADATGAPDPAAQDGSVAACRACGRVEPVSDR